jgi:hypothetical protein
MSPPLEAPGSHGGCGRIEIAHFDTGRIFLQKNEIRATGSHRPEMRRDCATEQEMERKFGLAAVSHATSDASSQKCQFFYLNRL